MEAKELKVEAFGKKMLDKKTKEDTVQHGTSKWSKSDFYIFFCCSALSFFTRFFDIHLPSQVVYILLLIFRFDEVHFGGFASNYIKREYFFDVHPPLGKMLFALVGYLFGYDGSFSFAEIGLDYPNNVPFVAMRMAAALFGSLLPIICFLMMKNMKMSRNSIIFAMFMIIFGYILSNWQIMLW